MRAVREAPPNPHVILFHVDDRLTDEIVETYVPGSGSSPPEWVRRAVALPGLRALSLNAYKIQVQKHKDAAWAPLLTPLEELLRRDLGIEAITEMVEEECLRRRFCWHGPPRERRVYEGRRQATSNPAAAALFELHGVAEVIFDGHEVHVRRCPLVSWERLGPEIEALLAERAATLRVSKREQ